MQQKLKQKIKSIIAPLAAAFLLIAGGFFVYPKAVHAANFSPNSVILKTELLVDGKNDNLIRIVSGASKQFSVVVTVSSATDKTAGPAPQITFKTDTFDFDVVAFSQRPILGFGVGLDAVGAANSCSNSAISGVIPFFTNNKDYLNCSFIGGNKLTPESVVKIGDAYKFDFTMSSAMLSSLKMVTSGSSTPSFVAYPFFNMDVALAGAKNITFSNASKTMFVQVFATQAELDQAVASGLRPADVPGYGSNSGSGGVTNGGDTLLGLINKIIMFLLGLINEFVYFVFYWLIAPILQAVLSIHTYTDTFVNVIYPGWEVVRNVCNIFFIVAIIAIAMATLLRVEGYQFRHLLVQLIMAALLVNFSLVIAQAILALADTIQSQFLPNNVDVIRSLARDLMVSNVRDAVWNLDISKYGSFSQTITFLFWVALALGSFAVFAGLAAMLVIRVVALWVLLMVSPVAYVAGVIPSTAGMKQEWWSTFLKYAFFTPVIAFFLNMTAKISETVRNQELLQKVTGADFRDSNAPELTAFVFKVFSNILLLVFLMVAIKVADSFGIYGANVVSDVAKGGILAPFKMAGGGIGAGLRKLNEIKDEKSTALADKGKLGRLAFSILNPTAVAKAREERSAERRGHIEHRAQAAATDVIDTFFNTSHGDTVEHSFVHGALDKAKEMPKGSERVAAGVLKQIAHQGKTDLNAQLELMGALNNMAEEKGMNYVLAESKKLGLTDKNYETTAKGFVQFINDIQRKYKIRDKDMAGMTVELGKSAYDNKEFWYAEMAGVDGHGHAKMITTTEDGTIEGEEEYKKVIAADEVYKEVIGAEDDKGDAMSLEDHVEFRVDKEMKIQQRLAALAVEKGVEIDDLSEEDKKTVYDSPDIQQKRKQVRSELKAKYLKTLEDKDHGEDPLFLKYDNWRGFQDGQKETFINFSKLAPQTRARDGHWNTQVNISPEGGYSLSYHGLEHILKADKGDFGQGDQLPLRKREALVQALAEETEGNITTRLAKELENIEVAKLYNAGVGRTTIEKIQKSDEFKDELKRVAKEKLTNYKKHYIGGEKIGDKVEIDGKKVDVFKSYQDTYINKVTEKYIGHNLAAADVTPTAASTGDPAPTSTSTPTPQTTSSPPSSNTSNQSGTSNSSASGTSTTTAQQRSASATQKPAGGSSAPASPVAGSQVPSPQSPPLAPSPASPSQPSSPPKPTP